jgi:hypothetical protein
MSEDIRGMGNPPVYVRYSALVQDPESGDSVKYSDTLATREGESPLEAIMREVDAAGLHLVDVLAVEVRDDFPVQMEIKAFDDKWSSGFRRARTRRATRGWWK